MKISRLAWVWVLLIAVALGLFVYKQARAIPAEHSVTLRWTASPGATSYNVYRAKVSGGPYTKIGAVPAPPYRDEDVTSGATFYYVVTAVREGKESKYSSEIKASVP